MTPPVIRLPVRILSALALVTVAATALAAQIDFARRHTPGIAPVRYLLPQATHVWAPGLGAATALAIIAWALHRGSR